MTYLTEQECQITRDYIYDEVAVVVKQDMMRLSDTEITEYIHTKFLTTMKYAGITKGELEQMVEIQLHMKYYKPE